MIRTLVGLVAGLLLGAAIFVIGGATPGLKVGVTVTVIPASVVLVSPASVEMIIQQGDSETFTVTLRNDETVTIPVQVYLNGAPAYLTVGCPPTGCVANLAPGNNVIPITVTAESKATLGVTGFTLTFDDPVPPVTLTPTPQV